MDGEQHRDYRWLIVVALYIVAAFCGVADVLGTNELVYALSGCLFALLTTGWCHEDAWQRGKPLLPVVQMIVLFTWLISVPIYLISSRKLRGVGYVLLHGIGLLATINAFSYATLYVLFGP